MSVNRADPLHSTPLPARSRVCSGNMSAKRIRNVLQLEGHFQEICFGKQARLWTV